MLVGIAFALSMAGVSVAQQPAATEQKKEMTDKKMDKEADKGDKKTKAAKKGDKAAAADKTAPTDKKDEMKKKEDMKAPSIEVVLGNGLRMILGAPPDGRRPLPPQRSLGRAPGCRAGAEGPP